MGGGPVVGGATKIDRIEGILIFLCLKIAVLLACQLTVAPFRGEIRFSGPAKNDVVLA